jgi:hypothetical protein
MQTKQVEIKEGMTGIDAIEKLLEIKVSQADDVSVVTIPMKETKKEEQFLVLVSEGKGICIHLNSLLAFVGTVNLVPKVIEPQSNEVKDYVR